MAGGGLLIQPSYTEDVKYPAYQDRLLILSLGVQSGVVEPEDFKVSAGTGLQVNIKKGKAFAEQSKAIEESSNTFYNGLYNVLNPIEQNPYNNVEVPSTNPQIAQIIIRVYDVGELKIGGESYARLEWLNGSPNVNATEAKMKEGKYEGRAELSQSSLRLANVLIPKNATKSSEYYIEDARSWSNIQKLTFVHHPTSFVAKNGEMAILDTPGMVATLPSPTLNNKIGFFSSVETSKIKCSSGKIFGDFLQEGSTEITLSSLQHVILQAEGTYYFIVAGEPKYENSYGAIVARADNTEYIADAKRKTFVILQLLCGGGESQVDVYVGTAKITSISATNIQLPVSFYVPAGVKWRWHKTGGGGTALAESSYLVM
jgi:hypothetical protein